MAKSLLSILRFLVPSWLYEGPGGAVVKSHATVIDEHADRARAGLEARFPSMAQDDALALIGQDRGIQRGRDETSAHYAQRLIGWRYPRGHRVRGSAFAALNQISEYFGGVACWSIDVKGNRHYRTIDNQELVTYGFPWNWDGTTSPKGRFWFVLYAPPGFSYTLGDVDAIRGLFTGAVQWRPGGTQPEWVIVDTSGTFTDPVPDGLWLNWSKNVGGTQVQARSTAHAFWSLAPTRNNAYAGTRVAGFPTLITECGGGTFAGSRSVSFPTTATLPSGTPFAGSRAAGFPPTIQLFDDGDLH
jgi:hypothetical protein